MQFTLRSRSYEPDRMRAFKIQGVVSIAQRLVHRAMQDMALQC